MWILENRCFMKRKLEVERGKIERKERKMEKKFMQAWYIICLRPSLGTISSPPFNIWKR